MRVAIIGGGINGYCCAVRILERLQSSAASRAALEVTVISDAFTPHTTGDGSAGLWGPYLLGGTSTAKVHKWSKDMHDFLEQLWLSEDAGAAGICLIPVVRLTTDTTMDDFWKDIVYGCTRLTAQQLQDFNATRPADRKQFRAGMHFVTYTSEPRKLLPYLMQRFASRGGRTLQRQVTDLASLYDSYDAIVNCSGLGARQLLPDERMFAVRGQVSRVRANWLYYVLLDESDDGNYIIPNMESVVLGGTHQTNDYSTQVSAADKRFIEAGCRDLVPALAHAEHLYDWVGLRPGRDVLRLEAAQAADTGKILIHNYGHGGSGVTLAWGCAGDVLQLLEAELKRTTQLQSKL